jgi:hypothetical protein
MTLVLGLDPRRGRVAAASSTRVFGPVVDGEAWWVRDDALPDSPSGWPITALDRECDTCHGAGKVPGMNHSPGDLLFACPDCSGTGRHTFTVEVENEEWHCETCNDSGISHTGDTASDCGYCPTDHTYRVSVVPGMVLPIVTMTQACSDDQPLPFIIAPAIGYNAVIAGYPDAEHETVVTLPSAAAPGLWAVKLRVLS